MAPTWQYVECIQYTILIADCIQLQDDRKAADNRLKREQDELDRALQAARDAGDKDRELKELAAKITDLTVGYFS